MSESAALKGSKMELNRFLDSVGITSLDASSLEDILNDVNSLDVDRHVLVEVKRLLEEAWNAK